MASQNSLLNCVVPLPSAAFPRSVPPRMLSLCNSTPHVHPSLKQEGIEQEGIPKPLGANLVTHNASVASVATQVGSATNFQTHNASGLPTLFIHRIARPRQQRQAGSTSTTAAHCSHQSHLGSSCCSLPGPPCWCLCSTSARSRYPVPQQNRGALRQRVFTFQFYTLLPLLSQTAAAQVCRASALVCALPTLSYIQPRSERGYPTALLRAAAPGCFSRRCPATLGRPTLPGWRVSLSGCFCPARPGCPPPRE